MDGAHALRQLPPELRAAGGTGRAPACLCATAWIGRPHRDHDRGDAAGVLDLQPSLLAHCKESVGCLKLAAMTASPIKWSIEAEFVQACSCDYGCPCEFSAPPTRGFCEGTGGWRIIKGNYGDVSLDGVVLGFAAHWPKAIHDGNGTMALFIDERSTPAQRDALLTICSGKAGGLPFEILATTITKVLEPVFAPVQFDFNGRESSIRFGDALNVAMEPIKNPVTK